MSILSFIQSQTAEFFPDLIGHKLPEFKHICDIKTDLSALKKVANRRNRGDGKGGEYYWHLVYNIGIFCFLG